MSQHSSQNFKHSLSQKHTPNISKSAIIDWLESILPLPNKFSIDQLGDGEIYCKLINHYYPNAISSNRIIVSPKNQYESRVNLKQFQTALQRMKIDVHFEILNISRKKFNQNWMLIVKIYKALEQGQFRKELESNKTAANKQTQRLSLQARGKSLQHQNEKVSQYIREKLYSTTKKTQPLQEKRMNFLQLRDHFSLAIDQTKEILLCNTHDTEKIRRIKVIFGLESNQIKIENDVCDPYLYSINRSKNQSK